MTIRWKIRQTGFYKEDLVQKTMLKRFFKESEKKKKEARTLRMSSWWWSGGLADSVHGVSLGSGPDVVFYEGVC